MSCKKLLLTLLALIIAYGCSRDHRPACPEIAGFCPAQYLRAYPDVAKVPDYAQCPARHYQAHGRQEGRNPCPSPVYRPVRFEPVGAPVKILAGHDNGIVTVAANGTLWMATGDGFVGSRKYETAFFRLRPGKNPLVPGNWEFVRGHGGKCYGMIAIGDQAYALVTDKGSLNQGSKNCRIYNIHTGRHSAPLHQALGEPNGINWFAVNTANGHPEGRTVLIGAVQYRADSGAPYGIGVTGPVNLFRGNIDDLSTFRRVGRMNGLNTPSGNITTVSVRQVGGAYIAGVGDWQNSIVYQLVAPAAAGPYRNMAADKFSPPMRRENLPNRTTGAFTLNFFQRDGQWYRVITGHGNATCDNVFIQRVVLR